MHYLDRGIEPSLHLVYHDATKGESPEMNVETLKETAYTIIDQHRDAIFEVADTVWTHPETGYKEEKTGRYIARLLQDLKLPVKTNLAIHGSRADLQYQKKGPRLAVIGELDSIILPSHPNADPVTGAVHACAHHVQLANLIGSVITLSNKEIARHLGGAIAFIAAPAEEFLETGYRLELVKQQKIRYCGGKAEMIRLGVFDDIDAAIMIHGGNNYEVSESYNGFVMKKITFIGKASHGGLAPWDGINALYAANIALDAINAQRDTFRDEDTVRIHGIITKGGGAVNVTPDEVVLEIQVRAKRPEAILDASQKVDRAMRAGATALGATVRIETVPGYMPLKNNRDMARLVLNNIHRFNGSLELEFGGHRGSSTDMGDVGMIMPMVHPEASGCTGAFHGKDFCVADREVAIIESTKILVGTVIDLMYDDASVLQKVIEKAPVAMTKAQYLEFMERLSSNREFSFT